MDYDIVPLVIAAHPCDVYSLAATRCLRWLFTGGADGIIRKWDFFASVNGKIPLTQSQRQGLVDTVTKSGVLLSEWRHEAKNTQEGQPSPVYSLDVHSAALWALAGLEDGGINLYTVRHDEGRCHHTLNAHRGPVSVIAISGSEFSCFSGGWDGQIIEWDLNTGVKVNNITTGTSTSQITQLSFAKSPESDHLLVARIDGCVTIQDVRTGQVVKNFELPDKCPPWCVAVISVLWVGKEDDKWVEIWDVGKAELLKILRLPPVSGAVSCVRVMPDNQHLLCASVDNIRLWDLSSPSNSYLQTAAMKGMPPFQIVPGHHGGTISQTLLDQSSRFLITASGTRGWDGTSNKQCIFYEIKTQGELSFTG